MKRKFNVCKTMLYLNNSNIFKKNRIVVIIFIPREVALMEYRAIDLFHAHGHEIINDTTTIWYLLLCIDNLIEQNFLKSNVIMTHLKYMMAYTKYVMSYQICILESVTGPLEKKKLSRDCMIVSYCTIIYKGVGN